MNTIYWPASCLSRAMHQGSTEIKLSVKPNQRVKAPYKSISRLTLWICCNFNTLIYLLKQQDLFWFIIWLNWHFYAKRNYKFISIYPLLVFGNTMISALNIKATNVLVTTNQIPQISKFGNLSDLESGVFSTDRVTPGWVTSFSYKIKCKQSPQPKQKVTCLVRETLLVLL